jgi:putative thioredoxin
MSEILDGNDITTNAEPRSGIVVNGPEALVIDSNAEKFGDDVINASSQIPIIVDFWAPWCEPCKKLTPMLENLVREYKGQVKLVKINIDENQALAQQLRVQSVPMVYAFKDGRPADAFNGALPESQLRQFIEKLTGGSGSPVDQAIQQANDLFEDGDTANASSIYNQILEADSLNVDAHAGFMKCLIAAGETEQARNYLTGLSKELLTNQKIITIQTALELEAQTAGAGDVNEVKKSLDNNPDNHQARFDYALALYGAGETEIAIEELVEIIKNNRDWNDDTARQQLFKIFEALGPADPITITGRRKMSAVLFS